MTQRKSDVEVLRESIEEAEPLVVFPPLSAGASMKSNVGGIDRVLRVVAGIALIALAATNTVGWWGWLGIVPLLTGLAGFCPLYPLLGLSTCPMKKGR
jgi:hypothetical protein